MNAHNSRQRFPSSSTASDITSIDSSTEQSIHSCSSSSSSASPERLVKKTSKTMEEGIPMVQVEAPATLSEGYVFWATLRDKTSFPVRVPTGGVESGQTLQVPLLTQDEISGSDSNSDSVSSPLLFERKQKGQWKDGLFSCFRLGLFHPHLCNAWLCPQVLLGQILVRMKMTWLVHQLYNNNNNNSTTSSSTTTVDAGSKTNHHDSQATNNQIPKSSVQSSFRKLMILVVLITMYDFIMAPPLFELEVDKESGEIGIVYHSSNFPMWHKALNVLLSLPMTIWGIMVVVRLRAAIRAKYGIPTGRLGRCEDFLCVCCCNCCVMGQMARQTADYEGEEPASCCSPNGIISKKHTKDGDRRFCKVFSKATNTALPSLPGSPSSFHSCSCSTTSSSTSNTNCSRRHKSIVHGGSSIDCTLPPPSNFHADRGHSSCILATVV
eukprot:CAMPEP_0178747548 /NCGR_PEP_ID=MMETSP0744-20121128/8379_1 /TAXON_ID=913974 /ORGANISM="Nitzschia punctata, Strain CCMP561" /LENGTH=436 /DNA_ID=CAMNT_0020400789 /DNA_START=45 /DNA_END=1355 /DNA_ORIENTATION=+